MYAFWFQDMAMGFKIFWMFLTYLLWGSVFYTSINIPYGSMASAISPEAKDRASLSSWRTIGATLANLVIGTATPLLARLWPRIPKRGQAVVLPVLVVAGLLLSTAYLVDATYNPFLYFRF